MTDLPERLKDCEAELFRLGAHRTKTPAEARTALNLRKEVRGLLRGPDELCCVCWKMPVSTKSLTGLRCSWCGEYGAPLRMFLDARTKKPRARRKETP
jgi:hypothetical protein